jgi:hypothetical protein
MLFDLPSPEMGRGQPPSHLCSQKVAACQLLLSQQRMLRIDTFSYLGVLLQAQSEIRIVKPSDSDKQNPSIARQGQPDFHETQDFWNQF